MLVFVSGGAKNGKSTFAQDLAVRLAGTGPERRPLYYIATMIAKDEEDERRIARHVADRAGLGFTTLERGQDIAGLLEPAAADPAGVFLLDSVTALLSNTMFAWDPASGEFALDQEAGEKTAADLLAFAEGVAAAGGSAVFVSDHIYSDARAFDTWTESYRRALADVDRRLAARCDGVCEVTYGIVTWHKGQDLAAAIGAAGGPDGKKENENE